MKRWLLKLTIFVLFILSVGILASADPINTKYGMPRAEHVIDKGYYVISYNYDYKIPNFVAYHLSKYDLVRKLKRSGRWKEETAVPVEYRATSADYRRSGYDKGHLCPSADMSRSLKSMQATFCYSNCAPQVGRGFNRDIWEKLEEKVRTWAKEKGEVWIYTGVFFDHSGSHEYIGNHVGVPEHWYKIVFCPPDQVIAFELDNKAYPDRNFMQYMTPVKQIEKETGLDFLNKVDKKIQDRIEALKENGEWN